jgi:hypothetical protein
MQEGLVLEEVQMPPGPLFGVVDLAARLLAFGAALCANMLETPAPW